MPTTLARLIQAATFASAALILAAGLAACNSAATPRGGMTTFTSLFNGKDLKGWKGLVADPPKRETMSTEQLKSAQTLADAKMREHWHVNDGVLHFDGKGDSLCTLNDYADFELFVDWKIPPGGDSGIYLRGSPQVQIWDNPIGSGGLYNNEKNPKNPLAVADMPIGEWNRFYIRMIGDKVTVRLNEVLVVDNVTLENYWERGKATYPTGQIELQNHGGELWFRSIYLRDLSAPGALPKYPPIPVS